MIYGFMNYNRLFIALVATLSVLTINGQMLGTDNSQFSILNFQLMDSIESNNTTLIALRTEAEARKLDNRTGIALPDPEVGLKRMWEGAEEAGKLAEFTVTQSIDLATATGQRSRVARQQNALVDEEYRLARMEVLLEAQLTCIDIHYYDALVAELDRRLTHARHVADAEKNRFDHGDTDILAYNNVLLSLSALEAERTRVAMERDVLTARLTTLNGGKEIALRATTGNAGKLIGDTQASDLHCQADFDTWYAQAEPHLPQLAQARQLIGVRSSELALAKTMHLPSLSASYINERHTIGTRSQGVAVGMSLPLWANKNRIRSARTALEAAEAYEADAQLQRRSQYAQEFTRVKGLQHTAQLYRRALDEANNSALLEKAMDEGFISVLEYLQGIELYYDYLDRSLDADRDYLKAWAQLEAWRL